MKILSRIARLVRHENLRDRLCDAKTPDEFYNVLLDAEAAHRLVERYRAPLLAGETSFLDLVRSEVGPSLQPFAQHLWEVRWDRRGGAGELGCGRGGLCHHRGDVGTG